MRAWQLPWVYESRTKVDPFDYLTQLQRHATEVAQRPSERLPWTYRETLARLAPTGSATATPGTPDPTSPPG